MSHVFAQIFFAQVWFASQHAQQSGMRVIPVARHGCMLVEFGAVVMLLAGRDVVRAQSNESGDLSIELVDPKVLRVCADPRNLPFSNEKGEGFENKLGEFFAEKLQKKLDYSYFPQ